jgi:hypothetical protein
VLEDVLRPPFVPAGDRHAGVEQAAERDEIGQDVLADALDEEVALAPAEGHAGRHVEAERGVAAGLLRLDEERVLEDPVAVAEVVLARHRLELVEVLVACWCATAMTFRRSPRATQKRIARAPLRRDERDAARRLAVWAAVGPRA